jgi:peptidyl-Lys metalloendopeptidase
MFSITLHVTFIALLLSATTTYAAPSLSLHLTGPQTVEGVENLKVIATVNNTGDETLKLLNDPRGPLNQMPADTFTISDSAGQQPSFVGIKVKYVPSQAAIIGKDDAFTVLEPGQSVDVEHDRKFRLSLDIFTRSLTCYCIQVSKAYDFTTSGSGPYSFEARKLFYYVHLSNSTVVPIQADISTTHQASVSGTLAIARRSIAFNTRVRRRATFNGCSNIEMLNLQHAASAAQSYVARALGFVVGLILFYIVNSSTATKLGISS